MTGSISRLTGLISRLTGLISRLLGVLTGLLISLSWYCYVFAHTVKSVLSSHSKIDKTLILKIYYR